MNLYFLVEGRSTEKKVYPKFIEYFFQGKLTRVNQFHEVHKNNYFLLSGNGYPHIFTNILKNSMKDINSIGTYNYLIICIDADENSVHERKEELSEYLQQFKEEGVELLPDCNIELVVQNRCIETWFLGNKVVYKTNPASERLLKFQKFYNVRNDDPELMPIFEDFDDHANFHFAYLKEMLRERSVRYTKNYPRDVAEIHYLERLIERGENNNHIQSFMYFYDLCQKIKEKIE